jgi:hypothetical protein
MMANINEQPDPIPNETPSVWDLVKGTIISDIDARDQLGRAHYGTPLQAFNTRDALLDGKEEVLDTLGYLRQAEEEREWINQELMKLYVQLAGSRYLQRADIVEIACSLQCILERNHAKFVE